MPKSYAESVTLANRLIDQFMETGSTFELVKTVSTGEDHNPTLTPTNYSVKAVFLKHKLDRIDGTLVQENDRLVYMSVEGLTVIPELNDGFIGPDGEEYTIVPPLMPLMPGDTPIFWEMNVRA